MVNNISYKKVICHGHKLIKGLSLFTTESPAYQPLPSALGCTKTRQAFVSACGT